MVIFFRICLYILSFTFSEYFVDEPRSAPREMRCLSEKVIWDTTKTNYYFDEVYDEYTLWKYCEVIITSTDVFSYLLYEYLNNILKNDHKRRIYFLPALNFLIVSDRCIFMTLRYLENNTVHVIKPQMYFPVRNFSHENKTKICSHYAPIFRKNVAHVKP